MDIKTIQILIKNYTRTYLDKYYRAKDEDERQKFIAYFYITISLFTLSFFGFFAIRPTIITIVDLNRQLVDNREVLQKIIQKKENLEKLTAEYSLRQNEIQLATKAIPNKPNIPYLSRQIETIALRNKVTLARLDFGSIEVGSNNTSSLVSFVITISAEGLENNVNLFIRDLASMERLLGFERMTTGNAKKNSFGAIISMRGYFLQ